MRQHYSVLNTIKSIDDIKNVFPVGEADELNFCMFSTSGVHGTYTTLDDIEKYYSDSKKFDKEENGGEEYTPKLTALIIHPRLVGIKYGNINVEKEDIPYLRKLADSSVEAMRKSQSGNLSEDRGE